MLVRYRSLPALLIACLLGAAIAWASITGSISGVVTDPSGAVVPNVAVTALNVQTGIKTIVQTDGKGFYNFPALAIGTYDIEVRASGFKGFRQSALVVDANSELRVDVQLQLGQTTEEITVKSEAVRVETQSTQMGEVIDSAKLVAVPLNGRAFTDLLSLQPGVIPPAYGKSVQAQFGGLNDRPASGDLNPGNQSVNGQRQASNSFMVNGANVEEGKNNGTAIVPNLDSIQEFRIITNNFDAEYGNFSGGQVNVATKSGTNQYHGSAFEFHRNTILDARNFFDTTGQVPVFIQNQFGSTFGGPIKKDKIFFFADYQGTRKVQGSTVNFPVLSMADRSGNLLDQAAALTATFDSSGRCMTNCVSGPFFAQVLQNRLAGTTAQTVVSGEPYFFPACNSTNPTSATGCVFPNAVIPTTAFSPAAVGLLQFVPQPSPGAPNNFFNTSSFNQRLRDDKGAIRVDGNTRFGMLSAYYFVDDYFRDDPYPNEIVAGLSNSAPGFNSVTPGRAQLINLGDIKSFGSSSLNEFRFSYVRSAGTFFKPKGGLGVSLSSLGFVGGFNRPGGIGPIAPQLEGVPQVTFANLGFAIGVPQTTTGQFNNTFQWQDNFSKIIGTHSLKFGGQFHYDQINERNLFGENGAFTFNGSETGVDFVDFLIGAPSSFIQASQQILDSRSKYVGLYVQDSWRARSGLTVNYGLRWEFSQPWYDTQGKIETIVPGEQSRLFPGAPLGWVVPGDRGIPKTLAPTKYNAFSPRLGLAYSPGAKSGFLAKLTGGPGRSSIRMGFGVFFTSVEDLTQFLEVGDAPFGLFWVSPNPPLFETPYIDRATGNNEGQKFPFVFPPTNISASNPDTSFNWAQVEPISSGFVFFHKNRMPYAEHYEFSLQRQVGANTVLSLNYVGTQGHKLITSLEANPGNAQLCQELNQAPFNSMCGPMGENPSPPGFVLPPGVAVPPGLPAPTGPCVPNTNALTCLAPCTSNPSINCQTVTTTRTALGPNFGSNPYEIEMANSSYNSLQVSVRHTSGTTTFLVGYTYSKCLDNASGLQDTINPVNFRLSRSLCAFDVAHNFVASYGVRLPFEKLFGVSKGWVKKAVEGWSVSGITTFATGLPVTLSENDDNSLIGTLTAPSDVPNVVPGKILNNTNPRSGQPYFNTSLFSVEQLGQLGNANRRFFHGPGINNWDMALLKDTSITESTSLEFRFEAFNIFNHAQFDNPDGLFNSSTFGLVTSAKDSRVMQVALKFRF